MRVRLILLLLFLLGVVLFANGQQQMPALQAQVGGQYRLMSHTATAGGISTAGAYQARVALGQTEAGLQTGGAYELGGGFWGGGPLTQNKSQSWVYIPLILR